MPLHPSSSRARLRRLALVAAATDPPGRHRCARARAGRRPRTEGPGQGHRHADSSAHKVTLVTGDVVTVTTLADGKQIADVDRPDDAVGGVRMQELEGDLYVVPDEAVGLLGADKLDRRLFDVTDLIEMGYDDAGTGTRAADRDLHPGRRPARSATPTAPRGSKHRPRAPGHPRRRADRAEAATSARSGPPSRRTSTRPTRRRRCGAGVAKLWLDGRVQANLQGERAADRRARGLGRRVRRHGRQGRGARHRHRRQPPRPRRRRSTTPQSFVPGEAHHRRQRARHARRLARSSAPAPPRTATTRASPRAPT